LATNYTSSFNAGEVSRKMDGRTDLEIYKTGCRKLDNFFVLPQGGVERRTGTEFIGFTDLDGEDSKLAIVIPFDFSSTANYVVEITEGKIRVWDGGSIPGSAPITVSGDDSPYLESELHQIQFTRRYDKLLLTHSNHPAMELVRTTIAPTFALNEFAFSYPPLREKNITSTTITADATTGTGGNLTATDALFEPLHLNSLWAIDHVRSAAQKEVGIDSSASVDSDILEVSFSNWEVNTSGTWNGSLIVQRSINNGDFLDYIVIANTKAGVARNFKLLSSEPEGSDVRLQLEYSAKSTPSGTIKASLTTDNTFISGLVKITSIGTPEIGGTASLTAVADIISPLGAATATSLWSESAFNGVRGFSPSSQFFQGRLWFAGSDGDPAAVYGSNFDSFPNFQGGSLSTQAIKRIIDTPETPKYIVGKKYLSLGTAGSSVSVKSVDRDSLITAANIETRTENAYGSAPIQAEVASDVIIYTQANGLKLRELVYDSNQDAFASNDLNVISEDITKSGISETFLQKQRDQIIWCIKNNGDAAILTYDRTNRVQGWATICTQGDIISGCSIQGDNEDAVWLVVKRESGYCIERFRPGIDLDWYVDSAVKFDGGTPQAAGSFTIGAAPDYKITVETATIGPLGAQFTPVDDACVDSTPTYSGQNYGSNPKLKLKKGTRESYIKFNVALTGEIASATLELHNSNTSHTNQVGVYSMDDTTWTEGSITWNTRPAINGALLEEKDVDSGEWATFDVSDAITSSGLVSFGLKLDQADVARYLDSKETTFAPVLKVVYTGDPHNLVDDDKIRMENVTGFDLIDDRIFTVAERTISTFVLKLEDGSDYMDGSTVNLATRSDPAINDDETYNYDAAVVAGDFRLVKKIMDGLTHLEGKTVQVLVDGNYESDQVVTDGSVTVGGYGNTILAGLNFESVLIPMPIEPAMREGLTQGSVKAIANVVTRFLNSKGGRVGESGKQLSTLPVVSTNDLAGEEVAVETGQLRFFIGSDWEREKLIEVRQDLPYPMTVLSITSLVKIGGN